MVKGKCMVCGCDIFPSSAVGYCYTCAIEVHEIIDKAFPFKVYDGKGAELEDFKTKQEAEDFLYRMQNSYMQ